MVEKMLFFAKLCAEIADKAGKEMDAGLPIWAQGRCDMLSEVMLRLKGNSYVSLKQLINKTKVEELQKEVCSDERDLMDYYFDWMDKESLVGVIVGSDLLYEVLYYGKSLWVSSQVNEIKIMEEVREQIEKIEYVFDLELSCFEGCIYVKSGKHFFDDGAFICKTLKEVEAFYQLEKGASSYEVYKCSGMSKAEFKDFWKRIGMHELIQMHGEV